MSLVPVVLAKSTSNAMVSWAEIMIAKAGIG